jgi:hypothetical protein
MLRATREFIAARQPHTDFVVGTMPVRPYPQAIKRYDIQDAVRDEVRRNELWRAVIGWRVYGYDREQDLTRFEPWWWILDENQIAHDVDPDPGVQEYIMDQALVIYNRERFEAHQNIRPPDLYLVGGEWQFRQHGEGRRLPVLDQAHLTAWPRENRISVTVLATNR